MHQSQTLSKPQLVNTNLFDLAVSLPSNRDKRLSERNSLSLSCYLARIVLLWPQVV